MSVFRGPKISSAWSRAIIGRRVGEKRVATSTSDEESNATLAAEYDYIVVGAGSAGCVVAHRLVTGDKSLRVLLTEAGPARDRNWKIRMPGITKVNLRVPYFDWCYETEPQVHMNDRRLYWPRGKVLGGSSALNAMAYVRGHAKDYDRWANVEDATGWSYADCLPYFKKARKHELGGNEYRGDSGPLHVSPSRSANPLHDTFVAAGLQAGYRKTDDFNGRQQEGFGRFDFTIKNGQRASTAAMYLRPAMKQAGRRLTVLPDTLVTKVVFNGLRAVGIDCQTGGKGNPIRRIHASQEIILCGGAVNSPQILLLSGVGAADHLRQHGIPVVQDLPGVGANLQDHLHVPIQYRCIKPVTNYRHQWKYPLTMTRILLNWWLFSRGDMISAGPESGGFVCSRPDVDHPDLEYMFVAGSWRDHGALSFAFDTFQTVAFTLRETSRGHIRLKSADPTQPPAIQPNYLATHDDVVDLRNLVKIGRQIFAQRAFDEYRGEEMLPGKQIQSDEDIDEFVRQAAETTYHPTSTCAMGSPIKNKMAVVDAACRVIGVDSLRVVDASVMPSIVSGNTNAPTIMIAEKVSDMLLSKPPPVGASVTA